MVGRSLKTPDFALLAQQVKDGTIVVLPPPAERIVGRYYKRPGTNELTFTKTRTILQCFHRRRKTRCQECCREQYDAYVERNRAAGIATQKKKRIQRLRETLSRLEAQQ